MTYESLPRIDWKNLVVTEQDNYSIRINGQGRVWCGSDAFNVEIASYHWNEQEMTDKLSPIHPGEVLQEEFIKPMNLSQNRLAIDIGVDARRINEIVLGKRAITADTALRLSRFFGNSPQFWMGLQTQYDLDVAEDQLGKRLDREVRPLAMAG
jgi:addiction module HigA family antidote